MDGPRRLNKHLFSYCTWNQKRLCCSSQHPPSQVSVQNYVLSITHGGGGSNGGLLCTADSSVRRGQHANMQNWDDLCFRLQGKAKATFSMIWQASREMARCNVAWLFKALSVVKLCLGQIQASVAQADGRCRKLQEWVVKTQSIMSHWKRPTIGWFV